MIRLEVGLQVLLALEFYTALWTLEGRRGLVSLRVPGHGGPAPVGGALAVGPPGVVETTGLPGAGEGGGGGANLPAHAASTQAVG